VRALIWKGALLSVLAATYLYRLNTFGGHMAAHLLLALVTPPLLLSVLDWNPKVPLWLGIVALNTVTVAVHLPGLHRALMTNPEWILAEAAAFLASGMLFWESVRRASRVYSGWPAVGLLTAQMASCALLGAVITFSRGVYMGRPDDVALGGVLMWVAGGAVYMGWAILLTTRALRQPERPISGLLEGS
jgi:putative membrane protein